MYAKQIIILFILITAMKKTLQALLSCVGQISHTKILKIINNYNV